MDADRNANGCDPGASIMGLFFLAQDDGTASTGAELTMRERVNEAMGMMDILHHPNELLDMLAGTPFIWASVSITVGVLCVLNGYRWHRWVVVVLAFCLGWVIGSALHRQFGDTQIVSIAIASLLAIIATPRRSGSAWASRWSGEP